MSGPTNHARGINTAATGVLRRRHAAALHAQSAQRAYLPDGRANVEGTRDPCGGSRGESRVRTGQTVTSRRKLLGVDWAKPGALLGEVWSTSRSVGTSDRPGGSGGGAPPSQLDGARNSRSSRSRSGGSGMFGASRGGGSGLLGRASALASRILSRGGGRSRNSRSRRLESRTLEVEPAGGRPDLSGAALAELVAEVGLSMAQPRPSSAQRKRMAGPMTARVGVVAAAAAVERRNRPHRAGVRILGKAAKDDNLDELEAGIGAAEAGRRLREKAKNAQGDMARQAQANGANYLIAVLLDNHAGPMAQCHACGALESLASNPDVRPFLKDSLRPLCDIVIAAAGEVSKNLAALVPVAKPSTRRLKKAAKRAMGALQLVRKKGAGAAALSSDLDDLKKVSGRGAAGDLLSDDAVPVQRRVRRAAANFAPELQAVQGEDEGDHGDDRDSLQGSVGEADLEVDAPLVVYRKADVRLKRTDAAIRWGRGKASSERAHMAVSCLRTLALQQSFAREIATVSTVTAMLALLRTAPVMTAALAAGCLASLAQFEGIPSLLSEHGAAPVLVDMLSAPEPTAPLAAAGALFEMSSEKVARRKIVEAGGLGALCETMRAPCQACIDAGPKVSLGTAALMAQEKASCTLLRLCEEQRYRKAAVHSGALAALMIVVEEGSDKAREAAALCLVLLAHKFAHKDKPRLTQALLVLLGHDTWQLNVAAARCAVHVLTDGDQITDFALAGGVTLVVGMLRDKGKSPDLMEDALSAMLHITQFPKVPEELVLAGAVPPLVDLLNCSSDMVRDMAIGLLKVLSVYDPDAVFDACPEHQHYYVNHPRPEFQPYIDAIIGRRKGTDYLEPSDVASKFDKQELKELKGHFKALDGDASGSIDAAELGALLESMGEKVKPDRVQEMLDEVDLDGNGTLEWPEFLLMVHNFKEGKNASLGKLVAKAAKRRMLGALNGAWRAVAGRRQAVLDALDAKEKWRADMAEYYRNLSKEMIEEKMVNAERERLEEQRQRRARKTAKSGKKEKEKEKKRKKKEKGGADGDVEEDWGRLSGAAQQPPMAPDDDPHHREGMVTSVGVFRADVVAPNRYRARTYGIQQGA